MKPQLLPVPSQSKVLLWPLFSPCHAFTYRYAHWNSINISKNLQPQGAFRILLSTRLEDLSHLHSVRCYRVQQYISLSRKPNISHVSNLWFYLYIYSWYLLNLYNVICMYVFKMITWYWIANWSTGVLFPGKDYFSFCQHFLFVFRSLSTIQFSRALPHLLCPIYCYILVWILFRQSCWWDFMSVELLTLLGYTISQQTPWCPGSYDLSTLSFTWALSARAL